MVLIEKLFELNMSEPKLYGLFHIVSLILTVLLIVILLKKRKGVRKVLFVSSLAVMILEIYKQLYFSYIGHGQFVYNWNVFPWQFCSTPMYIGILAAITDNKKFHYRMCCYLSTYALMAGICVMLYPVSVFVDNVLINIQTMVNHGIMIVIGIYLLLGNYIRGEMKTLLEGFKVFVVCVMIAMILNEWANYCGVLRNYSFNMFYISPYLQGELPVYSLIQENIQYPYCLIIYIIGFTIGSGLILMIIGYIKKWRNKYEYFSCR